MYEARNVSAGSITGQVQVASQLIQPTILQYTCFLRRRSGYIGSTGGVDLITNPEQLEVMLVTLFAVCAENQ